MCPRLSRHPAVRQALRDLDAGTSAHCDRTGGLAELLGRALRLPEQDLQTLRLAAQLHDVGKVEIPREILLKPGRLAPEEFQVMQTHARHGHDLLLKAGPDTLADVAQVVLHHHEAVDGTGYPMGLKGEAIPVLARVVAVADSYDAIASRRPYHEAKRHREVMRVLHEHEGGRYDPYVLKAFSRVVDHSAYRAD